MSFCAFSHDRRKACAAAILLSTPISRASAAPPARACCSRSAFSLSGSSSSFKGLCLRSSSSDIGNILPNRPISNLGGLETAAFQRRRTTNATQAQFHLCYLRCAATVAGVRKSLSNRFTPINRIQAPRESTTSLTPAESHSAGFDVVALWSSDPAT
jgi:hypothetical protein